MNEREYNRLRKHIEADYEKKIEALELVWAMSQGDLGGASSNGKANVRQARGVASECVSDAIQRKGGMCFSVRDIAELISRDCETTVNRTTIAHKLRALVDGGQLSVVTVGKGKRATIYRTNSPVATVQKAEELRNLLRGNVENAELFKKEVLGEKYGVEKIAELGELAVDELINQFQN